MTKIANKRYLIFVIAIFCDTFSTEFAMILVDIIKNITLMYFLLSLITFLTDMINN